MKNFQEKILIISVQGIGNTLLILPVLEFLRKKNITFDIIVSSNGSACFVENIAEQCFIYEETRSFLANFKKLKRELRNEHYQQTYLMYPNGKRENLLSFVVTAPSRGGYVSMWDMIELHGWGIKDKIRMNPQWHDMRKNFKLLRINDIPYPKTKLYLSKESKEKVRTLDFFNNEGSFLCAVHPLASRRERIFPLKKLRDLCKKLIRQFHLKMIFLGSPSEAGVINSLVEEVGSGAMSFCQGTVMDAAALIDRCHFFIGNDSSLMHAAAFLDIPSVIFWGFTDYKRTAPCGENSFIVRLDIPCSPCYTFQREERKHCDKACVLQLEMGVVERIISGYIESVRLKKNFFNQVSQISGVINTQRLWPGSVVVNVGATGKP